MYKKTIFLYVFGADDGDDGDGADDSHDGDVADDSDDGDDGDDGYDGVDGQPESHTTQLQIVLVFNNASPKIKYLQISTGTTSRDGVGSCNEQIVIFINKNYYLFIVNLVEILA